MEDRITTEVVNTIMEVVSTEDGVIDVPQHDEEGGFRKLFYYDDPDEIIPMEVSGDETEITFYILSKEHAEQYGDRIGPLLYGVVRALVKDIEPYPYGKGGYAQFNKEGSITFAIFEQQVND